MSIIVFILALLGTLSFSVNSENPEAKANSLRFDFLVKTGGGMDEIDVEATLYSETTDTLYFLTTSCEGEQYSLQYNADSFELVPKVHCNASLAKVVSIPPKGIYSFNATFRKKGKSQITQLGFDFYEVGSMFKVETSVPGIGTIHNRPEDKKVVVWSRVHSSF